MKRPDPAGLTPALALPAAPPAESCAGAPTVTVAICTHNRPADVGRCCESLAPQIRGTGFGFIIVDSGSDPARAGELRRIACQAGARYLRLDEPGLSRARNLACAVSRSDWVAFLDDDAIPWPDWVAALRAAVDGAPPSVAVLGGRTVPLWPSGAGTDHVTERWKLLLSCVDADGRGPVSAGHNVCGANLAVRRDAVALAGGFPLNLGRIGTVLLGGEESFLIERLSDLGRSAVYDGSLAVWHRVSQERLTRKWIARRAFWEGASQVALARRLGKGMPPRLWRSKLAITLPILAVLRVLRPEPDFLIRFHMTIGALRAQFVPHPLSLRDRDDAGD